MGYRVEVSHDDLDHYNAAPAHYGPDFGEQYREIAFHVTGEYPDLLKEAQKCADRFLAENPDEGWSAVVVELVPHTSDREAVEWREVTA